MADCKTETDKDIGVLPVFLRMAALHASNVVLSIKCRVQKLGFGVVVLLVGLFAAANAKAVSSVSLVWGSNSDPSVVGYNVYYGGESGNYTNEVSVRDLDWVTVGGLVEGDTYYFAVTAVDAYGGESDYSEEIAYIVPGFLTITQGPAQGDSLSIQFPVAPQHSYDLQVSQDLETWQSIWQVDGIVNEWVEFDVPLIGLTPRFFRVEMH